MPRNYTLRVPSGRRKPPVIFTCRVCGTAEEPSPKKGLRKVYCSIAYRNIGRNAILAAGAEARFWAGVDRRGPDECWLWQRSVKSDGWGYGQTNWNGRPGRKAHRVAWEITNGPIPEGLFVLHRCDVPACCNPRHLLLGTHGDNMRDLFEKRRHPAQTVPELRQLVVWLFNLVVSR